MKRIGELLFEDIPTKVMVSKSVRPKYIRINDKLPKKYDNYYYDFIDGILCNLQDNSPVIVNEEAAGKPKYLPINGQSLHQLLFNKSKGAESKIHLIKQALREYFYENLNAKIDITLVPIHIELKFYINEEDAPDLDNLEVFYKKIFLDTIQVQMFKGRGSKIINPKGIILNDDIKTVNCNICKAFFTKKNPYLKVNFYQYESQDEFISDRANIEISKQAIDIQNAIVDLANEFAMVEIKKRFDRDKITDPLTGEFYPKVMNYYQREFEYYTKVLTNKLL